LAAGRFASAQVPRQGAQHILHDLHKLQNGARVLYLAAHPDDENTRVISWLENQRHVRTAYLSLTRGDGGQNLIGPELGARLGVLRTQELMQARRIDGGEQFFSRAVDFGYSKTAEETLRFWDKQKVLADVVRVIRRFRPDVIITRFPDSSYGGHGHHVASAQLAREAFALAAQKSAFPGQLKTLDTWQAKRLVWNQSTWWNPKLDSLAQVRDDIFGQEVGAYNGLLGLSCNQIASYSRTQHKSQGFGVSVDRGAVTEYFQHMAGQRAETHLLEGVDTTWARYGWQRASSLLDSIIETFDPQAPWKSVRPLVALQARLRQKSAIPERRYFMDRVQDLIARSMGLHLEVRAPRAFLLADSSVPLTVEILNRSPLPLYYFPEHTPIPRRETMLTNEPRYLRPLRGPIGEAEELAYGPPARLPQNRPVEIELKQKPLSKTSQPYWLRKPYETVFQVEDPGQIGKPENPAVMEMQVLLGLDDQVLALPVTAHYEYSDRVDGEQQEPLLVVPPVTAQPSTRNLIFVDDTPQEVALTLRSFGPRELVLRASAQKWDTRLSADSVTFGRQAYQSSRRVKLTVAPQPGARTTTLRLLRGPGKALQDLDVIQYPHVEKRMVLEAAAIKLQRIKLTKRGQRIGYIPGAGDEVAEAIRHMGYTVDRLDEQALREADLSGYQAIVAGIRAYNVNDWLPALKPRLMAYVRQGGNYLVQYNTASRDLLSENIGPYPFTITRERVTEETAPAQFLQPEHPLLKEPNALGPADFEGWVQERGLYFAGEWHERYDTPLGWNDAGEPLRKGGLLVAKHGQGAFMYTGISFFRELPAGVPGAYRLLANMLSYKPDDNE
jgi:LmbE family N-acetylglucosaminyl deacetylase